MRTHPILFFILALTLFALLGCAPAESAPEPTPTPVTLPAGDGLTITDAELSGD